MIQQFYTSHHDSVCFVVAVKCFIGTVSFSFVKNDERKFAQTFEQDF
jgi:hypothetical protein